MHLENFTVYMQHVYENLHIHRRYSQLIDNKIE